MNYYAVSILARLIALYLRFFPISRGKIIIWDRLVRRYIAWRPIKLRTTTIFNAKMEIQLPDAIQTCIYFFGYWEPTITKYIRRALKPGDTFIDIGANVGYHTLLASTRVGSTGRVYCFEASPSIYAQLRRNLTLNHIKNVTSFNIAVVDSPCDICVYLHSQENLGRSTIVGDVAKNRNVGVEAIVQGLPLADIIDPAEICRSRVIKIDVEGAEWSVLKGMFYLIPHLSEETEVIVEISKSSLESNGATLQDILKIFRAAGYSAFVIENSYAAQFYIECPEPVLQSIVEFTRDQADIIFRRRN